MGETLRADISWIPGCNFLSGGTSPLDSTAAWIPEAETPSRYPTTVSAVGLAGFAGSAGLAGSTAGRDRHCQSAKAVSPLRLGARHQSRLARAGDRRGGLGAGARTVAAFCCDAIQRRRLGDHGSGRGQCYRCAVVCAQAAGGAGVGVQWVEHRRRCFLAALGASHRITGVSIGRHCDRCRRGRDNWILADLYYSKTPESMGLHPDGDAPHAAATTLPMSPPAKPLPSTRVWRDWRLLTLAAGMALGLFAQIGLLAHLFSLLVPALGAQLAGFAAGGATASAILGRTLVGWLMPARADRRLFGCANYAVQILGSLAFLFAAGDNIPLLLLGVVLFGAGIGNTTSLPPMIAQAEFSQEDVSRVVPLIVAVGQGTYAFAPAVFGLIRELAPRWGSASAGAAPWLFLFHWQTAQSVT